MTLAIPLYFDPVSEAAIQAVWQKLSDRQIAPYMAASGIRPHLTLAIYREIDPLVCQDLISPWIKELEPLPLTFSHLGVFPTPDPVVFVAPTVTPQLLDLHQQVYRLLDQVGVGPISYYLPQWWVPHCTLAVEIDAGMVSPAIEIAQGLVLPLTGWVTELSLIEYPPINHVFSVPFKG